MSSVFGFLGMVAVAGLVIGIVACLLPATYFRG